MTMPVSPGGAYFGFYSDFGDVNRGEIISYSSAVASAAAAGARDVGDIAIPGDLGSPNILAGHPRISFANGNAGFIEVNMTYDNGTRDDGGPPFVASHFLVELQGPDVASFEIDSDTFLGISHYVSSDGGQSIYLNSTSDALFASLTRMKIWRAVVFPGDPLPEPPTNFWTSFIGAREVI
ncbi:hypothetical protein KW843_22710 [Acidovorax sp. sif1233]|uniref:hypothetical protein n=1 Tax=Acidovorax sp. sif1233 TaxID=2854792 RepID=UPI001C457BA0|nr:hypothetical protein [Acidovorax sp. sif1233]MBV7457310.1 hypothetical protein [Acidovorax sp. sif1233]